MAGIAFGGCWNVIGRFSGRDRIVVATRTRTKNLGMIDHSDERERVDTVAVFADVGRWNMAGRLAPRDGTVVAAKAAPGDTGVAETGRSKRCRAMTGVTLLACWNVPRFFPSRRAVIVTTGAFTDHFKVVDALNRNPCVLAMARLALAAGLHVKRGLGRRANEARIAMAPFATLWRA